VLITLSESYVAYRWTAFFLWLTSCGVALVLFLAYELRVRSFLGGLSRQNKVLFLLLMLVTVASRLYALDSYPFMAINDEVRDAANLGQKFALGTRTDLFGFEWSQGTFSGALCSIFYHLFGQSLLTYRVPAALLSILNLALVTLIATRWFGARVGLLAGATTLCLPLELHYARTQTLIEGTEVCATALIGVMAITYSRRTMLSFFFLGIVAGFGIGLHASVYVLCYLAIGSAFVFAWSPRTRGPERVSPGLARISATLIGILVGVGPRILFVKGSIILPINKLAIPLDAASRLSDLSIRYVASLGVYLDKPFSMFFIGERFLTLPLSLLLVVGALRCLWPCSFPKSLCLLLVLLLPFTNSAATSLLNGSHRLLVVLPFVAILIALGFDLVLFVLSRGRLAWACFMLTTLFVVYNAAGLKNYFLSERDTEPLGAPHVKLYYLVRYVSEHLLTYGVRVPQNLCVIGCPECSILNTGHVRGFLAFYLPSQKIEIRFDPAVRSYGELVIASDCDEPITGELKTFHFCEKPELYRCPAKLPPLKLSMTQQFYERLSGTPL